MRTGRRNQGNHRQEEARKVRALRTIGGIADPFAMFPLGSYSQVKKYQIVPVNVGNFLALPKQTCMYRMYREVTYEAPCIMWYIKGTANNIIVDLGPPEPAQCLENHGLVIRRSKSQEPANALNALGLSPDDVKLVVLTHLHWDHACGFHLFKNARFLIQKKEVEYAIAPLSCHRTLYYEKNWGKPQFVDYMDRIDLIDGDYEVENGVKAIFLPSHSPGFQGVSVQTEKGEYFIAGDAVGLFECWETVPHVPSGIFNNLEQYYESMEKISGYVLPGHDARVFEKTIYP
jgi:N-acyl homoserine lactone hydrolase